MPIYEYRCSGCGRRFSKLVGMTADSGDDRACPKCGSTEVSKLISKFQRLRSDDERLDSFEDAALAGGDDPKNMSKLLREMGREMDDDGEGDFDEFVDEAEREFYDGGDDEAGDGG